MLQTMNPPRRMAYVLLIFTFAFLFLSHSVSATAREEGEEAQKEKTGWIEVTAEVPEGFTSAVIATVIHSETQEEYDIQLLEANGYTGKRQVPYGEYIADQAFVPADIRYGGIPESATFQITGKETAAAHVNYVVDILDAYKEPAVSEEEAEEAEPAPPPAESTEDVQEEEAVPDTPDEGEASNPEPEAAEPDESEEDGKEDAPSSTRVTKIVVSIILSVGASILFTVLVFLSVLLVRRHLNDDD